MRKNLKLYVYIGETAINANNITEVKTIIAENIEKIILHNQVQKNLVLEAKLKGINRKPETCYIPVKNDEIFDIIVYKIRKKASYKINPFLKEICLFLAGTGVYGIPMITISKK